MSFDWLLSRGIPKKKEAEQVPPKPQPKQFSHSVDSGYVDDIGVWHPDKHSADSASAKRLIVGGTAECTHSHAFSPYHYFDENMFFNFINKPDTLRAMAILSGSSDD